MKMHKQLILLFCVMISVVMVSNAQKGKHKKDTNTLTEDQQINLTYSFYNANKEKILGNMDKAAELFAQCLHIDSRHAASMYELANIYMEQKKSGDALNFAKAAVEQQPDNIWYQLLLAEIYQSLSKYKEAAEIYDQLTKDNPERVDFFFDLAQVYMYDNKLNEALKVYDKIELQVGLDKELTVQKERLYLKLNKVDKAAGELEKYIAANPSDMEGYSLLVELYQVNNQSEKAFEVIGRMQKKAPESAYVYLALAEYYREKGDKEKSFENLKIAFRKTDVESEIKIRVLSSYVPLVDKSPEMMMQAIELAGVLADVYPMEATVQAIYGDFMSLDKKLEEARKAYRASLALDSKNFNVWQQLLFMESQLNDNAAMLAESEEALSLFPSQPIIYLLNGIAKSQNKKHEEAIRILLTGSKLVIDNDAQLKDFYSNLGDNYNALKNYNESDKYYEKALEIDPGDVFILNNYAYYLSLRSDKLEKAADMSKKSNNLSENNASFQDTYAWILFRQNKLGEAREWLEKALKNGGDKNDTILEHYGDVLYKLGEVDKAIENWKNAKAMGPGSELLNKKIEDKRYYE